MDYLKINVLVVSEAKKCVCAKTHSHKGTSDTHKYKYKCKRNGICPNKSTENGILWVFRIRRNLYTFATQHRERERESGVFCQNHFETDAAFQRDGLTYSFCCSLSLFLAFANTYPFRTICHLAFNIAPYPISKMD